MNQAQDVSVVNYRIHKSFSLQRAAYIFDIAYLPNFFHRKPGIGISVASAYDDHQEVYSPDISVFTRGIFIEYNALSKTVLYGKDNAVFQTSSETLPDIYQEGQQVWTQGTASGFSLKGIAVCKSGKVLLSLWNNEIGERSVGKVISIKPGHPIEECVQIFTDKNLPLLVCPTYIAKAEMSTSVCLMSEPWLSRTQEACCASGIREPQEIATLSRTVCVAILTAT